MSISLTYASQLSVVQTFEGPYVSNGDNTAAFTGLNESGTLTASTSVPVTKHAEFQQALSSGTATLNLAALPGLTAEETVNGTGLKLQALKLRNLSTNANKITATKGASNGYGLDAAAGSWTVVLDPGQSVLFLLDESAPDIASGARTIDLSGTGAQILEVMAVMG